MEKRLNNPLVLHFEAKGKTAEIRIDGEIHRWENSARLFRRQITDALAAGVSDVDLYLNTPGGSCFEANEMANEILRFPGTIRGYGGALVASAGTYLACICKTFEMAENGQYMYHKPMGDLRGNEDEIAAALKPLQNMTKQYRKTYADKTGKSEDEIEAAWSKGDVWLSAQEALEQKFITGISKPARITKEQQALFVACGAPVVPEVDAQTEDKPNNQNNMSIKLITAATAVLTAYGLKDAENSEDINAAIISLGAALEKSKQEHSAEKTAREALQKQINEQKEATAKALIEDAIKAGKLTAEVKDQFLEMAKTNYDLAAKVIGGMPGKTSLSSIVNNGEGDERAKWSFDDWQDKDPKGLGEMEDKEPERFRKLFEAKYGA